MKTWSFWGAVLGRVCGSILAVFAIQGVLSLVGNPLERTDFLQLLVLMAFATLGVSIFTSRQRVAAGLSPYANRRIEELTTRRRKIVVLSAEWIGLMLATVGFSATLMSSSLGWVWTVSMCVVGILLNVMILAWRPHYFDNSRTLILN